jgi:hypothetical protein
MKHIKVLDNIITRLDSTLGYSFSVRDLGISDHYMLESLIDIPKSQNKKKLITYRKTKAINLSEFNNDIEQEYSALSKNLDIAESTAFYNDKLSEILEEHAPLQSKSVIARPNNKWYSQYIRSQKTIKRRLERKKNKTGLKIDILFYKEQCKYVNHLVNEAKSEFLKVQVVESKDDINTLFNTAKRILNWKSEPIYPQNVPNIDLPNVFANYFYDKIICINNAISDTIVREAIQEIENVSVSSSSLSKFEPATEKEITDIISKSPNASCDLDPVPTEIVTKCPSLVPWITNIVNKSLEAGNVPAIMKQAIITPLLKKPSLDPDILKNFRSVSNLSFFIESRRTCCSLSS